MLHVTAFLIFSFTQVSKAVSKAGYFGFTPVFKRLTPGCTLSN